jgi:hypothetical protein
MDGLPIRPVSTPSKLRLDLRAQDPQQSPAALLLMLAHHAMDARVVVVV